MSDVPQITGEQRLAALDSPVMARTRVREAVMAMPGYGRARADALMGEIGIKPGRRMAGLGSRQRARLAAVIDGE